MTDINANYISNEFECSVCLVVTNEPYLLPTCGHSFCSRCLNVLAVPSITCPTCRKICPNISMIVKNYSLIERLNTPTPTPIPTANPEALHTTANDQLEIDDIAVALAESLSSISVLPNSANTPNINITININKNQTNQTNAGASGVSASFTCKHCNNRIHYDELIKCSACYGVYCLVCMSQMRESTNAQSAWSCEPCCDNNTNINNSINSTTAGPQAVITASVGGTIECKHCKNRLTQDESVSCPECNTTILCENCVIELIDNLAEDVASWSCGDCTHTFDENNQEVAAEQLATPQQEIQISRTSPNSQSLQCKRCSSTTINETDFLKCPGCNANAYCENCVIELIDGLSNDSSSWQCDDCSTVGNQEESIEQQDSEPQAEAPSNTETLLQCKRCTFTPRNENDLLKCPQCNSNAHCENCVVDIIDGLADEASSWSCLDCQLD